MPFRAFYIDTGVQVTEQDLLSLGVEHFQINADQVDKEGTEPTLEKICIERKYNYKDVVSINLLAAISKENFQFLNAINKLFLITNCDVIRSILLPRPCLIMRKRWRCSSKSTSWLADPGAPGLVQLIFVV